MAAYVPDYLLAATNFSWFCCCHHEVAKQPQWESQIKLNNTFNMFGLEKATENW